MEFLHLVGLVLALVSAWLVVAAIVYVIRLIWWILACLGRLLRP